MGRSKDSVQIDKYALENAMLANETSAQEVSVMLGHAKNYMAQVVSSGGWMKRRDYDNLKGLLRVTDTDIVKAIPVQRSEEVESIYQPRPVAKKQSNLFVLEDDNARFIERLLLISGGGDKNAVVNTIIRRYLSSSVLGGAIAQITDWMNTLAN